MSLLLGLAYCVMDSKESNHSLLMRYYQIEKEIEKIQNESWEYFDQIFDLKKKQAAEKKALEKKRSECELAELFLFAEARTILYRLGILQLKRIKR